MVNKFSVPEIANCAIKVSLVKSGLYSRRVNKRQARLYLLRRYDLVASSFEQTS